MIKCNHTIALECVKLYVYCIALHSFLLASFDVTQTSFNSHIIHIFLIESGMKLCGGLWRCVTVLGLVLPECCVY